MDAATERDVETLAEWVRECPPGGMCFFGGAGVSTGSGIPDFRSTDGLYNEKWKYPPEVMISRSFFDARTAEFYEFYCERMLYLDAEPNAAHVKLAALERDGRLRAVVTQNIDGLHQAAGSESVIELHGSVHRNFCMCCGAAYDAHELLGLRAESTDGIPKCSSCGGIVKPDVVLYEEPLDEDAMLEAVNAIAAVELLVVAGTSLVVQPAAGLISAFGGEHLVVINRDATAADEAASLALHADICEVLSRC